MEVIVSKVLGFCGGVKLSYEKAFNTAEKSKKENTGVYLLGNLVNNSYVSREIESLGIKTIPDISYLKNAPRNSYVIIRAHGIKDCERESLENLGFKIVDATCPVVLKNQSLVRDGKNVIVIGYRGHAEVEALSGASCKIVVIIEKPEDLSILDKNVKYEAVLQTTFNENTFSEIKSQAEKLGLEIEYKNEICSSSKGRREALKNLKGKVDALLVVGDKHSANCNGLRNEGERLGLPSFIVDSSSQLEKFGLEYKVVGFTASASTSESEYRLVLEKLRSL